MASRRLSTRRHRIARNLTMISDRRTKMLRRPAATDTRRPTELFSCGGAGRRRHVQGIRMFTVKVQLLARDRRRINRFAQFPMSL
jgi:hypothetical protein